MSELRELLAAAPVRAAVILILLGMLSAFLASTAGAQEVQAPTRETAYDWQCQDAAGAKISDHQRFDTAFIACLNAPNGAYVQGGRYRLNRPTTGSATISWTPPTQNTDGSPLTDLAGFRIVYGTSPTALTQTVEVPNAAITAYVVSGLTSGTWYFAVKAYNRAGVESALSNVASKTL